jgi:hypothetical protein
MNSTSSRALASAALSLLLSGCGGGGTESGSPEEIFVSPAEVIVTGSPGACAVGEGPTVHLYGGLPPYKLSNSVPSAMVLDTMEVEDSGDGFTIHFTNGTCVDGGADYRRRPHGKPRHADGHEPGGNGLRRLEALEDGAPPVGCWRHNSPT